MIGRLFDRWWPLAMVVITPLVVFLNYESPHMQGVYPYYDCYADAIRHGIDPAANTCPSTTFPMWGYGWLLAVTSNEIALLVFQNLTAVAAAWVFLRVLEARGILGGRAARLVKVALVVSFPWYAFHSVRWPYSEAVTLLLLSLACLLHALDRPRAAYRWFLLSGLLFGLLLEFRSDYILLPLAVAGLVVLLQHPRGLQLRRMGVWLAAILAAIVPWTVYAHRATGQVLLTSTNGGHVLFISLGQLPGNPWGITPRDDDPRMHRELDAHFGRTDVSSLTAASDRFLRARFVHLVREHPGAYARKVAYNVATALVGGAYPGDFLEEQSCRPLCRQKYGIGASRPNVWEPLVGSGWTPLERLRYGALAVSEVEARAVGLAGYVLGVLVFVVGLRRRSVPLVLVGLVCTFQLVSNALAYDLSSYTANAYLPMLVSIAVAAGLARERLWVRRRASILPGARLRIR